MSVEFQAVGRPCCVSESSDLYSLGHSGRGGRELLGWEGLIPAGGTTHQLELISGAQPVPTHGPAPLWASVSFDAHFLMPRARDWGNVAPAGADSGDWREAASEPKAVAWLSPLEAATGTHLWFTVSHLWTVDRWAYVLWS